MKPSCQIIRPRRSRRQGTLQPAIAFALLVVGAAIGLVLNSLWKDSATVELRNAAEAAALAAAGEYLNDALLAPLVDPELQIELAKLRAAEVAFSNRVAGQPVELDLSPEGDIQFGTRLYNHENNDSVFIATHENPDVVEVRATRLRSHGNPLWFFFSGVTGRAEADAQAIVEVAFENLIDHFQPTPSALVPCLPLAILASDPQGKRTDTWAYAIEQRHGPDFFRFDETTRQVIEEPDGIPEIELKSVPLNSSSLAGNVHLLEFANDLGEMQLISQIAKGLTADDLRLLQGRLPAQDRFDTTGSGNITTPVQMALEAQIGQPRLCLLYPSAEELNVPGWARLICQGVVAIRVLQVLPEGNESATVIVQPTVMTTKTAVLARFLEEDPGDFFTKPEEKLFVPNRFVYKIFLNK